jgi:tetratricopeptide (TPR) repeat protein
VNHRLAALAVLTLIALAIAPPTAAGTTAADGSAQPLPYEANQQIEDLAQEISRQWHEPVRRIEEIVQRIFWKGEGGLGFQYRSHPTLTAAEAFDQRQGNCLSLVNLFVALGRSVGMRVFFVEVEDFETFYRYEGTIVRSTHVVGGVVIRGELRTVDFLPERDKRYRRLRIISDQRALAHYYNGVGAEAMLDGDLERAGGLFRMAVDTDPEFAGGWNNYAILTRRKGRLDDAIELLERALRIDSHFLPAMENLSSYYRMHGRPDEAARLEQRALDERTRNPYYLTHQALSRLGKGDLDEAEKLLRRARRLDRAVPDVHLMLGRIELARGNEEKAETHFAKARKFSQDLSPRFREQVDDKIRRLTLASHV